MQGVNSLEKTLKLGKTEGKILSGHEQTLGDSERQGSLVCCSPRNNKESDLT